MTGDDGQSPLAEAVKALRLERGLSQEAVAFAMRDHGGAATAGAVGQVERGMIRPLPATIEALAAALGVDPGEFPEYRLATVRRLFDEREVGLEQALANLSEVESALGDRLLASDREVPQPETDASPSARRAAGSRSGRAARRRRAA